MELHSQVPRPPFFWYLGLSENRVPPNHSFYLQIFHEIHQPAVGEYPLSIGFPDFHEINEPFSIIHYLIHCNRIVFLAFPSEINQPLILVGGFNPFEKYESQLGWLFRTYGKIVHMFQSPPTITINPIKSAYIPLIYPNYIPLNQIVPVTTSHFYCFFP